MLKQLWHSNVVLFGDQLQTQQVAVYAVAHDNLEYSNIYIYLLEKNIDTFFVSSKFVNYSKF